jgi:predicted RNA-binding protein YlxR (DUF448 family)
VADDRGHLVLDTLGRAPGRGVYVCPSLRCIEGALRRGGFARGLRRRIAPAPPEELARRASAEIRRQALDLVRRALADGRASSTREGSGRRVAITDQRTGRLLAALVEQLCRLQADLAPSSDGALK